jgi:OOP family OmpA-OmpF porin
MTRRPHRPAGNQMPLWRALVFSFTLPAVLFQSTSSAFAAAAESYNPTWAGELAWASGDLFHRPTGAFAIYEDAYVPWWQNRVAHPIADYDASKLTVGAVRLDTAFDFELTRHRLKESWNVDASPSAINNVYTFTPGSTQHDDAVTRAGQNAYVNLGMHPFQNFSADIGAEFVGNYDQRFWFPVNDEHRMYNDDRHAKIVRGEIKYDTKAFMIRGFEGVPLYDWTAKNDLFRLFPAQIDVEMYRHLSGSLVPRGGEMRAATPLGTLTVLGGSEIRLGWGSSVYAKYDAPAFGNLEQSVVYRNENIPFGLQDPDERRWTATYNASYPWSERLQTHAGLLYQPFRLDRTYQNADELDGAGRPAQEETSRGDAFGVTARAEFHPTRWIDHSGLGYTYLGPVAGNKHQVEADASRGLPGGWVVSAAYMYRQPVIGPVPLIYEGTPQNPGAFVATPRGPDDPFWVQWDNRQAHIGSLTLVFDPTPGTLFFKHRPNILEDWNLNPDEDARWSGAIQYRVADYLTNTDRLYYWDEDRRLHYDPVGRQGAHASDHPLSSFSTLVRWRKDQWRVMADVSAGEALAGSAQAYVTTTDFYKPSTLFLSTGLSAQYDFLKAFIRYGKDVWGPVEYFTQLGWTYHKVYQAGLAATFLRDFEAGFRYVGTRMGHNFIGSNVGAFNEYRAYLTYHFGLEHNFGKQFAAVGSPLPQTIPESRLQVSDNRFTPDGSTPVRSVTIYPRAAADAGVLSYKLFVRNAAGETVRKWEGSGKPPQYFRWEGLAPDAKPLPPGTYRITLDVVDLYGNEVTSPAQSVELASQAVPAAAPAPAEAPVPSTGPVSGAKNYTVTSTAEGLRVTLSSMILFDVNQEGLRDGAKQNLDQVVDLLKAYPTNRLRVSGYTDSSGSDAYNQTLSEKRAQAVAAYLEQRGIQRSRISAVGFGKRRAVASNATEQGRLQNRRVEIDILK